MSESHSVVSIKGHGVSWRAYEKEMCETYMGPIVLEDMPDFITVDEILHSKADTIVWKLHTEYTDENLWKRCVDIIRRLPSGIKHINDPRGWMASHAKEEAFKVWRDNSIPVPDWFEFSNSKDFWEKKKESFDFPMLVRVNNANTGYHSYLVNDEGEAKQALKDLDSYMSKTRGDLKKGGALRRLLAVKFISTVRPENVIMSFRIIVAADKVVTGYARLGSPSDWIAITNRFESQMEETFITCQKVCSDFCHQHEDMLVKSVRVLGLNFQGVDVILDQNNNPYFLEVQPGFSTGYFNRANWNPPFYNPSRPPALVEFLKREKFRLQKEIPFYTNYWLNKNAMFDRAYASLRRSLHGD